MRSNKVQVKVLGITYSHLQQGAYVLLLADEGDTRRVPVVVGTAEAQSIALSVEKLDPPRPMTHDLLLSITNRYGVHLEEVFIYRFDKGVFFSTLTLNRNGEVELVDSRTSDAVALALRTQAPIYMARDVLNVAGFEPALLERQDESVTSAPAQSDDYEAMSDSELKHRIERAVAIEAYEEAAAIQEILQKRKI